MLTFLRKKPNFNDNKNLIRNFEFWTYGNAFHILPKQFGIEFLTIRKNKLKVLIVQKLFNF